MCSALYPGVEDTCIHTHTRIHTYIHIRTYIHVHTYIQFVILTDVSLVVGGSVSCFFVTVFIGIKLIQHEVYSKCLQLVFSCL